MAGDSITFFAILTFFVVVVIVGIVRAVVLSKRYEVIVRDWARENGYAIVTIEPRGRLLDYMLYWLFGPLALIPGLCIKIGPYGFRLLIQDEQGGQTHVSVFVGKPGKPVDVRWEYDPWQP